MGAQSLLFTPPLALVPSLAPSPTPHRTPARRACNDARPPLSRVADPPLPPLPPRACELRIVRSVSCETHALARHHSPFYQKTSKILSEADLSMPILCLLVDEPCHNSRTPYLLNSPPIPSWSALVRLAEIDSLLARGVDWERVDACLSSSSSLSIKEMDFT